MIKNINRDMTLMDVTKKSLPACHVFKMLIKAFVDHLKIHLDRGKIDLKKVRWVIPVSAYLNDTGKLFLMSCAKQVRVYFNLMIQHSHGLLQKFEKL